MARFGVGLKVLAVDDDENQLYALETLLTQAGFQTLVLHSGEDALNQIRQYRPDLILLDIDMPGVTGLQVCKEIKEDPVLRYIPVMMLTAKADPEDVVEGLGEGADDYVSKPYNRQELLSRLKALLRFRRLYQNLRGERERNRLLSAELGLSEDAHGIIGDSPKMEAVFSVLSKIKDKDVPVLINGESGTGKELIARYIHFEGSRSSGPFVVQNCAALNETTLESILFGHVKGAFTGATHAKVGLFEAAHQGTFFLDELGEMSEGLQAKLLRVLQDGSFTPVGANDERRVDVRILAATNRDLMQMVKAGKFREDLYYRLNVINLELPPLRDRAVDVPKLAGHFLVDATRRWNLPTKILSEQSLELLKSHTWPGNVRELKNEIERAAILSGEETCIEPDYFSAVLQASESVVRPGDPEEVSELDMKAAVSQMEREYIQKALDKCGNNKSEAARLLGISRSNLLLKIQAYGF